MKKIIIILFFIPIFGFCQESVPNMLKYNSESDFNKADSLIISCVNYYENTHYKNYCEPMTDSLGYWYCEIPDSIHVVKGLPSRLECIYLSMNSGRISLNDFYFLYTHTVFIDRKKLFKP